jgi:hypothetical protein
MVRWSPSSSCWWPWQLPSAWFLHQTFLFFNLEVPLPRVHLGRRAVGPLVSFSPAMEFVVVTRSHHAPFPATCARRVPTLPCRSCLASTPASRIPCRLFLLRLHCGGQGPPLGGSAMPWLLDARTWGCHAIIFIE